MSPAALFAIGGSKAQRGPGAALHPGLGGVPEGVDEGHLDAPALLLPEGQPGGQADGGAQRRGVERKIDTLKWN